MCVKNIQTFEKYHSDYKTIKLNDNNTNCKCGNIAKRFSELDIPMCNKCYNRWWIDSYIDIANSMELEIYPIENKTIIMH